MPGNTYADSDSHSNSDSNTNGHADSHSYSDGYSNSHTYTYVYSNSDTYRDGNSDSYVYAYTYTNSNSYSHAIAYSDSHVHSDGNGDSYVYSDTDGNSHGYIHTYSDSYGYVYAYTNPNSYSHAVAYTNSYIYSDTYGDRNSNTDANLNAEACSDDASASDSAAAADSVGGGGIRGGEAVSLGNHRAFRVRTRPRVAFLQQTLIESNAGMHRTPKALAADLQTWRYCVCYRQRTARPSAEGSGLYCLRVLEGVRREPITNYWSLITRKYRSTCRQISECHRRLIGTSLATLVAHLIRVGRVAAATDDIGVETVIGGGSDQRVVAVNVHVGRCSSTPREIGPLPSLHFVAARTECDSRGSSCRSRSCRWCNRSRGCSCRSCARSYCCRGRCCRCWRGSGHRRESGSGRCCRRRRCRAY